MSTLWTPDGERPVNKSSNTAPAGPNTAEQGGRNPAGFSETPPPAASGGGQPSPEQAQQMEEPQRQLAETPADVVVANHCFGLFELAALHLSIDPPNLADAQLAIDALAALVESLSGRLGEAEPHLRDGLSQLRVAFVQIRQRASQN